MSKEEDFFCITDCEEELIEEFFDFCYESTELNSLLKITNIYEFLTVEKCANIEPKKVLHFIYHIQINFSDDLNYSQFIEDYLLYFVKNMSYEELEECEYLFSIDMSIELASILFETVQNWVTSGEEIINIEKWSILTLHLIEKFKFEFEADLFNSIIENDEIDKFDIRRFVILNFNVFPEEAHEDILGFINSDIENNFELLDYYNIFTNIPKINIENVLFENIICKLLEFEEDIVVRDRFDLLLLIISKCDRNLIFEKFTEEIIVFFSNIFIPETSFLVFTSIVSELKEEFKNEVKNNELIKEKAEEFKNKKIFNFFFKNEEE